MIATDVARVLAKAAAYDQRTVGEGDILAWMEAIGDLDLADALVAVTHHYRESTDWLRPAHVRRIVNEIDRERRRQQRERREESERLALEADPTRRDRSPQVRELLAQLRVDLPEGDPDKLRRPEWLDLDRRRARWGDLVEPNPYYDPSRIDTEGASTP